MPMGFLFEVLETRSADRCETQIMRVKTRRLPHLATQPRLVATLIATVLSLCVASRVQAQVTVLRGRVVLPTSTIVGEVMFSGDTIMCAAAQCDPPANA